MIAGDGAGARDRRAAGVAGGDEAGRLGVRDHRHVVVGGLDRAEAGLRQRHAPGRQLDEVLALQPGFENDRAGDHPHAARAVVGEAALRRQRQGFHALHVARTAGHVHLGGGDRGGDAAVQVAFEKTHRTLARRIVAEGDVDVGIDQAGDRGHAAGVDHHIGALHRRCGRGADADDAAAIGDDGVALRMRIAPVARYDVSEIDDRGFHGGSSFYLSRHPRMSAIALTREELPLHRP